jgi:hypothetical protein
LNHL